MTTSPSRFSNLTSLICAVAAVVSCATAAPVSANDTIAKSEPAAPASVADRMSAVQHFGITVTDIARAHEFYTEVLGGTEVLRDGDFQGAGIQNTLMQVDENDARASGINPRSAGVPDLRGGAQRLDVVFIQFDNVVVELLQYRDANQERWKRGTYAPARRFTSPAFPTNMHVSFEVHPDANFDQFIHDLERAAHARGMTAVRCNRIVDAKDDAARAAAPIEAYANEIRVGVSNGWSLAYCKGPEGEQLEFNQVHAPIDAKFRAAQGVRK